MMMMGKKRGIVVATHPEDHSVDLVLSDGRRMVGVQVKTLNGSARTGTVDLPSVPERADKWDITSPNGQDMIALVDFVDGYPVVDGFLYPQVNQMLLNDPEARRYRHQSDVETLIDGQGNIQLTHPSGTYIRIGETTEADTLAGKHADESATDRNTGRRVNIHIGMAGGTLELTMTPDGAVSLKAAKGGTLEFGEASTIKAPTLALDADVTITKSLTVQGDTSVQGITSRDKDIGSTHRHENSGGPATGGVPV